MSRSSRAYDPFKDESLGKPVRRVPTGYIVDLTLEEEEALLRESGITVPEPAPMPPPAAKRIHPAGEGSTGVWRPGCWPMAALSRLLPVVLAAPRNGYGGICAAVAGSATASNWNTSAANCRR